MDTLAALARVFAYLSFLTIGGGMAAYPEMKVQVVQVHRWLTNPQLVHIYSTGQMSPGPNMMMVAQIGQIVSGFPGAVVCALAFFVPTGILTFGIGRLWKKLEHWPWRVSIQKGLAPVAIGLAIGGLITFGRTSLTGWLTLVIGFATFAAVARTKINPVFFILGAGVIGVFALR
ncbi:MAG TPA: chromate transporter [Candidatus Acidoferrales bacterium]|jgi:chromate transporter|nr:chromate transporter [Candidatus Acidoferrales bacterium]